MKIRPSGQMTNTCEETRLARLRRLIEEAYEKHPTGGCPLCMPQNYPVSATYRLMLLSEPVLAKDWDTPEEDEAWELLGADDGG